MKKKRGIRKHGYYQLNVGVTKCSNIGAPALTGTSKFRWSQYHVVTKELQSLSNSRSLQLRTEKKTPLEILLRNAGYHFLSQGKSNLSFVQLAFQPQYIKTSSSQCHSASESREGSCGRRNNSLYQRVFLGSNKHARHLRNISCLPWAVLLSVCSDTLRILRGATNHRLKWNKAILSNIPRQTYFLF